MNVSLPLSVYGIKDYHFRKVAEGMPASDQAICQSWFLSALASELPLDGGRGRDVHWKAGGESSRLFGRFDQAMHLRVGRFRKIRVLPKPEDRLRTLVERAPQAEAWADRTMAKLRPTLTLLYGLRRRLATAAVAVLTVWLFAHVMFGDNGMVIYRLKKAEYQTLQKEIDGLQKENDRYTQQVKALQAPDPNTIEKEAREQLHYTRPGEVVYVAPPAPHVATRETNAAQK
jgi:cell division protein FtsB